MHSESGLVFPVPSDVIRQRMMVAEFVARQQSGSPVNGETPNMNGGNGGHNSNGTQNISSPSPGTPFLHDQHSHHGHHNSMMIGQSPLSPHCSNSQDGFSNSYDLAAHLKRKDLFTQRKQREFIPDNKKDDSYWDRRRRNNEAAKRSREKRRYNDMVLEQRVVELTKENYVLKAQLEAIKDKYNICGENLVSIDQVMATFPSNEQVLSITKRQKLSSNNSNCSTTGVLSPQNLMYPQTPSPVPTSVIHKPILLNDVDTSSSSGSPINHQHQNTNSNSHNYNSNRQSPPTSTALQQGNTNPIEQPSSLDRLEQYTVVTSPPHHQNHLHHHHYPYQNHHPHHHHELMTQYVGGNTVNGTNVNAVQHDDEDSVLNLSRRGVGAASPYEISSGTGSGAASGDDEQCENQQQLNDTNNSLPLKLRHKSHLGDKDAASALLALQHIKQEPNSRASPPSWDGEGSSDERDSGISICTAEWVLPRKIIPAAHPIDDTDDVCLESKLAKLESEVASIKNMMILKTAGTGSTAAAQ